MSYLLYCIIIMATVKSLIARWAAHGSSTASTAHNCTTTVTTNNHEKENDNNNAIIVHSNNTAAICAPSTKAMQDNKHTNANGVPRPAEAGKNRGDEVSRGEHERALQEQRGQMEHEHARALEETRAQHERALQEQRGQMEHEHARALEETRAQHERALQEQRIEFEQATASELAAQREELETAALAVLEEEVERRTSAGIACSPIEEEVERRDSAGIACSPIEEVPSVQGEEDVDVGTTAGLTPPPAASPPPVDVNVGVCLGVAESFGSLSSPGASSVFENQNQSVAEAKKGEKKVKKGRRLLKQKAVKDVDSPSSRRMSVLMHSNTQRA